MSQRSIRIGEVLVNDKDMSDINNEYCNIYDSDLAISEAIRMAGYEKYMQCLSDEAAKRDLVRHVLSKNGALEYATSGSALTDFDARATEFRNADESVIRNAAMRAYAENPVDFIKLMFQTGDIREGKGERHAFNTCMDWLVAAHPFVATEVLSLIPEYTRWDYLVRQTVAKDSQVSECATAIVVEQFNKDLEIAKNAKEGETINISLLAKWMPSLQTKKSSDKPVVRHMLRSLHMKECEYRKALSMLRGHLNVIEKAMSKKDYDAIDMEKLSSKQQLRYAEFFDRVLTERRHEYIQAVLRGEKKMNVSVLNPLEILHDYARDGWRRVSYNEDYEALWSLLPDKTSGDGNTLVIRDGSGSMTARIGQGSSATMLEAATAMAIYCAEHLTGAFKDKFITFSNKPKLVDMSGCRTLADKINLLYRYDDYTNTDLEATFDLVLATAVKNKLSQEEIPAYLMILSDMEFDEARGASRHIDWENNRYVYDDDRDTLFATIREKWEKAGYDMPTLVFWELNGERTIYPEIDSKNGVIYLSGFSTNDLELVMSGAYETIEEIEEELEVFDEETGEIKTITRTRTEKKILTPKQQLELKLSATRYDAVEEAVRRGLEREVA